MPGKSQNTFFSKCLHSFWNHRSISQNSPHKTTKHTQHTKHTHTAYKTSHTSCKSKHFFEYFFIVILHSNSTNKHKIISHIYVKLHTDVKNVKHYSCVFRLFKVPWRTGVCHSTRTYCTCICTYTLYIQYVWLMNFTQLHNRTESILTC